MPRLGDTFHNVFGEDGKFVGFADDVPATKEVIVKNLQVKEAHAFRVQRYGERRRLVKQPRIHLSYNKENLFIIDRRVCWDLIRNFDPEIRYLRFLEMLEYQSEQSWIYSEMILPRMEEYSGNFEIPLSEELYLQLCRHLDSDRIEFMGIA